MQAGVHVHVHAYVGVRIPMYSHVCEVGGQLWVSSSGTIHLAF